jgi:hypothetical protein
MQSMGDFKVGVNTCVQCTVTSCTLNINNQQNFKSSIVFRVH